MKKVHIVFAVVLMIVASSCGDQFLVKRPTQQLSYDQIKSASAHDPSLLTAGVAGLYAAMYADGTSGNHDDFGQKGFDIYSDMLSSDMLLGATHYGWYANVARYQSTKDFTTREAYQPWAYYYRIILGANFVIDGLGGTDAQIPNVTEQDKSNRASMGQAKAMRAYAYFYLAHLYSPEYGDGTQKILPIYTNSTQPNQPMSTAADVYNLMISDLTQAVNYLNGFQRTGREQIDKYVAEGLLAYVYAARAGVSDLQQVVTLTDDVINNGGFPLATADALVAKFAPPTGDPDLDDARPLLNRSQAGFNNVNSSPNWMWGIDLTLSSNLDLVSWWGQVDLFTYSYAWAGDSKVMDDGLYAQIDDNDIRKQQFVVPTWDNKLWPINKFFSSVRTVYDNPNEEGGQRYIVDDYVYMRVEEMYLLNAEANAKLGQAAPARTKLKALLDIRLPGNDSYVDALSGTALQNEIYLQTRIELWGEGKSYLALKRNKATCTRGSTDLFLPGQSFAYNSDELTFPIPQQEVLNNPVLNK